METYNKQKEMEEIAIKHWKRLGVDKNILGPFKTAEEQGREREEVAIKPNESVSTHTESAARVEPQASVSSFYEGVNRSTEGWSTFKRKLAEKLPFQIAWTLAKSIMPESDVAESLVNDKNNSGALLVAEMEKNDRISPLNIDNLLKTLETLKLLPMRDQIKQLRSECLPEEEAKLEMLIKCLKERYRSTAKNFRVSLLQDDRLRNVDEIYVESQLKKFVRNDPVTKQDIWEDIGSTNEIFSDGNNRVVIDGEPGYGKTTLAFKFVEDWCKSNKASFMNTFEIVIFIRMRHIVNCTKERISPLIMKKILSPLACGLSEKDLQNLMERRKLCIIFDGLDEVPELDSSSDIAKILKEKMYQDALVITTARSNTLHTKLSQNIQRYKLAGFNNATQEQYMKKNLEGLVKDKDVQRIVSLINSNPHLANICQVPLFFAFFSYDLQNENKVKVVQSLSDYVSFLFKCFFLQHSQKESSEPKSWSLVNEASTKDISKIAFKGLQEKTLLWDAENFISIVGRESYEQCKSVGILLEEKVSENISSRGSHVNDKIVHRAVVKFLHKTFQEYYGAIHLVELIKNSDSREEDTKILKTLPFNDNHYVYRFACGLHTKVAKVIVDFLITGGVITKYDTGGILEMDCAVLCLMEMKEETTEYLQCVRKLSELGITVMSFENEILLTGKAQIANVAGQNKFPIRHVVLFDAVKSISPSDGVITLPYGLCLSNLSTVYSLHIVSLLRKYTHNEIAEILECIDLHCPNIRNIKLEFCSLPDKLCLDDTLKSLGNRSIEVGWSMGFDHPDAKLDFKTGLWIIDEERFHRKIWDLIRMSHRFRDEEK